MRFFIMLLQIVCLDIMCFVAILLGLLCSFSFAKDTIVSLTAPVNPVEEGGVIGIHCQVTNLKDGQEEVSILKLGKFPKRLSLDDKILADDENIFIAKRQLDDGSLVFFLSLIDVKKDSVGDYRCRVSHTVTADVVAYQDVKVDVMYFPGETDPICNTNMKSLVVAEGTEIRLNCSSQLALPTVNIAWKKPGATNDNNLKTIEQNIEDGRKSSILTIRPKVSDSGSVYLCEITSRAFPNKLQTCHIGPITVQSNVNPRFISTAGKTHVPEGTQDSTSVTAVSVITSDQECSDICATYTPQRLYWVIATAGATLIALVFFILVMILCIKYHNLEDSNHNGYTYPRYPMEKIYSEVESRRVDDRVYMSLVKLKKNNDSNCLQEMTPDGRYHSPTLEIKQ